MDTDLIAWTIEIRELKTGLRFGAPEDGLQPVSVDIGIRAQTPARPQGIGDCVNYQPICEWVLDEWPRKAHTALLDGRARELMAFIFAFDARIESVELTLSAGGAALHRTQTRRGVARPDTVIDVDGTLGYDCCAERETADAL